MNYETRRLGCGAFWIAGAILVGSSWDCEKRSKSTLDQLCLSIFLLRSVRFICGHEGQRINALGDSSDARGWP